MPSIEKIMIHMTSPAHHLRQAIRVQWHILSLLKCL